MASNNDNAAYYANGVSYAHPELPVAAAGGVAPKIHGATVVVESGRGRAVESRPLAGTSVVCEIVAARNIPATSYFSKKDSDTYVTVTLGDACPVAQTPVQYKTLVPQYDTTFEFELLDGLLSGFLTFDLLGSHFASRLTGNTFIGRASIATSVIVAAGGRLDVWLPMRSKDGLHARQGELRVRLSVNTDEFLAQAWRSFKEAMDVQGLTKDYERAQPHVFRVLRDGRRMALGDKAVSVQRVSSAQAAIDGAAVDASAAAPVPSQPQHVRQQPPQPQQLQQLPHGFLVGENQQPPQVAPVATEEEQKASGATDVCIICGQTVLRHMIELHTNECIDLKERHEAWREEMAKQQHPYAPRVDDSF